MILLVKAKYVDPSLMDLFGGEAPLQQKKTGPQSRSRRGHGRVELRSL